MEDYQPSNLEKLMNSLIGTDQTIQEAIDNLELTEDDLPEDYLNAIDNELNSCYNCGYWEAIWYKRGQPLLLDV